MAVKHIKPPIDASITEDSFTEDRATRQEASKPIHLLVAFVVLFIPMVALPLLLIAFVYIPAYRQYFPNNGTPELPVNLSAVSNSSYYTYVNGTTITLVSSWAPNMAQFGTAPFMFIFSFLVAFELASERNHSATHDNDILLGLLQGGWQGILEWIKSVLHGNRVKDRAIHVAAIGALLSCIFSFLLIVGDKLLHGLIIMSVHTIYDDVSRVQTGSNFWPSFTPNSYCAPTLSAPLQDPFFNMTSQPCSLDTSSKLWSVRDPPDTYRALDTAFLNATSDFNKEDFAQLDAEWDLGSSNGNQLVSHVDQAGNLHVLLFNPFMAREYDLGNYITNFGKDYVANTTSMVTVCKSATQARNLHNQNTDGNLSIPFNCSGIFSGDLNKAPSVGLEQFKGWNSSFYYIDNGVSQDIPVSSQLNPFTFNATAAVSSIDFSSLVSFGDHQTIDGAVVDAGDGRVAFALSCTSTIYDVTYSLVGGNIAQFKAAPSTPQKASIIKAPLQVGFGRHVLFQQASMAIILTQITVAEAMGLAFSQVGMALAAANFDAAPALQARDRWNELLTEVPKAPLLFLVAICLMYAALVLGLIIVGILVRRDASIINRQASLVPRLPW
ncbi:hypothetical protein AOQ84DRAFT_424282 [Glonium stellatum]|uniref:Uncharacterized protein n=1 Tax=Glonium stellatum TaxID=574774 RepID=A0A8E2JLU0_9PEZI|nr:hypothetical protein AOQ84DRAFT_424282 [Glonium stellatum]